MNKEAGATGSLANFCGPGLSHEFHARPGCALVNCFELQSAASGLGDWPVSESSLGLGLMEFVAC